LSLLWHHLPLLFPKIKFPNTDKKKCASSTEAQAEKRLPYKHLGIVLILHFLPLISGKLFMLNTSTEGWGEKSYFTKNSPLSEQWSI
jgi:hypothetical protein